VQNKKPSAPLAWTAPGRAAASQQGREPVSLETQRKIAAILQALDQAGQPLGSTRIARVLQAVGIDLEQRMVRNYLEATDAGGLTINLGRRGRKITPRGRQELTQAVALDKVGYVGALADDLAYRMSFDLSRRRGTVILNVSTLPAPRLREARRIVAAVMGAGLGMGRFGAVDEEGGNLAGHDVAPGEAAIGTVCSITLNGLLRAAGVPVASKFGGLLELRDREPVRFTQIIHYEGTTLDPLEIFIQAGMTSVGEAARTGNGLIGASFREVPAAALPRAEKVLAQMREAGLGGLVVLGHPSRPLLDVPVAQGRAGLVAAGGLNPLAAVHESGIPTRNRAMARLCDFAALAPLA